MKPYALANSDCVGSFYLSGAFCCGGCSASSPVPYLDGLAKNGLRFTQFYNGARCCPTRASLLTGLYPHQAGVGSMTADRGPEHPGYRGTLQPDSVTLAEVLHDAGYYTFFMHLGLTSRSTNRPQPEEKIIVAEGWFDRQWTIRDSMTRIGDPEVRAKSVLLKPSLAIDPRILESYVGRYALPGVEIRVKVINGRLTAQPPNSSSPIRLVPISEEEFFVLEGGVRILMVKDSAGKVVSFKGWRNGQEFSAKKVSR